MNLMDEQRANPEPLIPEKQPSEDREERPRISNQEVLNGILWVVCNGAAWKDLPDLYPSLVTCHHRFREWGHQQKNQLEQPIMNPDIFAEWMRRQGRRVYHTKSSYWYEAGPHVLQAFPYHWLIQPSKEEIRSLMLRTGTMAMRYSTPLEFPGGKVSYHVILKPPYNIDMLKNQARNGVKRGLNRFKIEQISFERLATEGWLLQQDTLVRQDRLRSMTQAEWERICYSAQNLSGFEAWAAIADNELAGAVIICRIADVFNVPYAMSHSKFLGDHVNNVIFYTASCEMLGREGVKEIFFTVQSLDAPASVDEFKFRMGLMPKAVCQHVDFHPGLTPFAAASVHALITQQLRRDPSNPVIAKAEGLLRFYLQGKQAISEQDWPDCLSECKAKFLGTPVVQQ
jgi:transposase